MMLKPKAVFLDRDGVINELIERLDGSFTSPWLVEEFKFLPYVQQSINIIKSYGFMIFIVTNQPGVHDGYMDKSQLDLINKMLKQWLRVDDIYCALDKTSDYYKPNNGMLEHFIEKYNIDRENSYIIGDRWKDIVPGFNSKLNTIFVGADYVYPHEYYHIQPDYIVTDILDASCTIMEIENDRLRRE
jgi:UDP-N-acetylmuramoyl-tripeptide--D-alanyl-D-alanine ligase